MNLLRKDINFVGPILIVVERNYLRTDSTLFSEPKSQLSQIIQMEVHFYEFRVYFLHKGIWQQYISMLSRKRYTMTNAAIFPALSCMHVQFLLLFVRQLQIDLALSQWRHFNSSSVWSTVLTYFNIMYMDILSYEFVRHECAGSSCQIEKKHHVLDEENRNHILTM